MPPRWVIAAILLVTFLIAHYTTPRRQFFAQNGKLADPAVRAEAVKRCTEAMANHPDLHTLVDVLRVQEGRVAAVACQRLADALAAGQISFEDAQEAKDQAADPDKHPDLEVLRRLLPMVAPPPGPNLPLG